MAQWYAEGMEKYGKNLPPENFEPITTSQEENQHPILEFSKRRKNSNFTGVKFKVWASEEYSANIGIFTDKFAYQASSDTKYT